MDQMRFGPKTIAKLEAVILLASLWDSTWWKMKETVYNIMTERIPRTIILQDNKVLEYSEQKVLSVNPDRGLVQLVSKICKCMQRYGIPVELRSAKGSTPVLSMLPAQHRRTEQA